MTDQDVTEEEAVANFHRKMDRIKRREAKEYKERRVEALRELGRKIQPGLTGHAAFLVGAKAATGSAYGPISEAHFDGNRSSRTGSLN